MMPTIKDRVAQAIVKNALEPEWEVRFETNSYGFRPGRSCQDAIEQCWTRLNAASKDEWILDADIKGAFDNISHEFILKALGATPGREWIKRWLKAGYVEAEMFNATESGTPQGGVISPLLANIALDGMERWLNQETKTRLYQTKTGKDAGKTTPRKISRYGFVRYADDFIVTAETKEDIEAILPKIVDWLAARGLKLNEEKTRIRHKSEGFNFLGFHIRTYGSKCLTKPQKEKVQAKLKEMKEWLNEHLNVEAGTVVEVLNPILRGWANYYKHGVSKETFATFDHHLVKMLIKWAKRKHPGKGVKWVVSRYFGRIGGDKWKSKAEYLIGGDNGKKAIFTGQRALPLPVTSKSKETPHQMTHRSRRTGRRDAQSTDEPTLHKAPNCIASQKDNNGYAQCVNNTCLTGKAITSISTM